MILLDKWPANFQKLTQTRLARLLGGFTKRIPIVLVSRDGLVLDQFAQALATAFRQTLESEGDFKKMPGQRQAFFCRLNPAGPDRHLAELMEKNNRVQTWWELEELTGGVQKPGYRRLAARLLSLKTGDVTASQFYLEDGPEPRIVFAEELPGTNEAGEPVIHNQLPPLLSNFYRACMNHYYTVTDLTDLEKATVDLVRKMADFNQIHRPWNVNFSFVWADQEISQQMQDPEFSRRIAVWTALRDLYRLSWRDVKSLLVNGYFL